jgi:hypothetical protein
MDTSAYVEAQVATFRRGDRDAAFFGLIGSGFSLVAPLTDAFQAEKDPVVRAFLVEALWQQRDLGAIWVLADALNDRNDRVWKEALNGLVTLASPEAIAALRHARDRAFDSEKPRQRFLAYLEEAIEQAEAAVAGG